MCCNPAKGRVEFVDGWLIKSSFITKDEMNASQLTRTKSNNKKQNKKLKLILKRRFFITLSLSLKEIF
jgi:hypothetical protein